MAAAAWRRQRGGGSVTAAAWRRRQPAMSLLIKLKTYPMAMLACVPASRSGMALDSSHQGCGGFGAAQPLGQCQIVYRKPVRVVSRDWPHSLRIPPRGGGSRFVAEGRRALGRWHQGCGGFGAAGPLGQCQIVYRTPVRALYSKARIGHIVSGSHRGDMACLGQNPCAGHGRRRTRYMHTVHFEFVAVRGFVFLRTPTRPCSIRVAIIGSAMRGFQRATRLRHGVPRPKSVCRPR